jgi:hypothetical protein
MDLTPQFWANVGFIAISMATYVIVCWGLALGGWRWLSKDYVTIERPKVKWRRVPEVRIGSTFHMSVQCAAEEKGLHIRNWFPFLFHSNLLIPWDEITLSDEPPVDRWTKKTTFIVNTRRGPIRIQCGDDLGDFLKVAAKGGAADAT